jgi:hypothetical protein
MILIYILIYIYKITIHIVITINYNVRINYNNIFTNIDKHVYIIIRKLF